MKQDQKLIVVVEDDPGMRGSLEFLLDSHGLAVAAFEKPEDLLARFAGLDTGCAILDIHLPGPDGLAVYQRLVALRRDLPVIFITGRADDRIRAESVRLRAVALLEKPFSDEALLDAVDRALHRPHAA